MKYLLNVQRNSLRYHCALGDAPFVRGRHTIEEAGIAAGRDRIVAESGIVA
jgi:hypothetical protein